MVLWRKQGSSVAAIPAPPSGNDVAILQGLWGSGAKCLALDLTTATPRGETVMRMWTLGSTFSTGTGESYAVLLSAHSSAEPTGASC